jgi:hypothetical protein
MVQAENIDSRCSSFQLDDRSRRDHHSLAHLSKFPLSGAGAPPPGALKIWPVDKMVGNARGVIFSLLFAGNVERLYVAAQPKEGGMPHLALTRPLAEFYLAYELGNKPSGRLLVLHFLIERLFMGAQGCIVP